MAQLRGKMKARWFRRTAGLLPAIHVGHYARVKARLGPAAALHDPI